MVCLALATPVAKTATPEAARLGRSGGSGQGRIVGRISSERVACECRRLQHLHSEFPVIRPRWPPHLHIKDREQFISGIPSTQTRSRPTAWRILQVGWRVWLVHSTGMDI